MQTGIGETAAIRRRNLVQLPAFVVTYSDGHEVMQTRVRAICTLDAILYVMTYICQGANLFSARLA